ncbi:hypothetical protein MTO96_038448 [Rhipicephalus appendiculatus]
MPQLPEGRRKVIVRPRGGLNLIKVSTTAFGEAIVEAAGLTADQAKGDIVCPNFTQNIVVVQCRGCGLQDPGEDHIYSPKCKFCCEDHPTGDKACKQRYQIPYVVRVRRRERFKENEAGSAQPTKGTSPGAEKRLRSRRRSRSRHRSTSRGTSRSRSRESQLRFEEQELKTKKKEPGVTWAEKVKGTVKATGNGALASQVQSNDARVEQLMKEVISLKKANEELRKQVQEMNKGFNVESGSAAMTQLVSTSNNQEEEGTPAPKKRAVVPDVESMCSVPEEIRNAIRDLKDTVERVNLKVKKIWMWKLTAEKRLKTLEAQGEDDELMPSEAPGAVSSTVKRTVTGG